jgi:predicted dehydrogenase
MRVRGIMKPAVSDGTLVEKCCHFSDLMNLIIGANLVQVIASGSHDVNHKDEEYDGKILDILDNAYVIVEYDNGSRAMLNLCMFVEGGKNEQEVCVAGVVLIDWTIEASDLVKKPVKQLVDEFHPRELPVTLDQCRRDLGSSDYKDCATTTKENLVQDCVNTNLED